MPISIPAASCPAPVAINATPEWVDTNTVSTATPPTSLPYDQGEIDPPQSATLNGNATRYDNITRYGAGGYGIGQGLVLSAGSGVTVNVSDGHAILEGLLEVRSAAPVTCADAADRWVWLKQDGSFSVETTTAKPAGNCIFLGKVTCSGGVVTSIDTSGVVYFKSGLLYRETGDVAAPLDSPNAGIRIWTKTVLGTYFWNGTAHLALADTNTMPQWRKFTFSHTDLSTAGLTITKNLSNMPAGAVVHGVKIRVTTAFAGPGVATMVFDVGITGATTKYINGHNALATGQALYGTPSMEDSAATIQALLTATTTGANLNVLTQGSVDVWLLFSVAI